MLAIDTPAGSFVKRLLDIAMALVGLVVLAPLLTVVAALVWLDDPGPVFFRQERVGMHGAVFRIWKLRTMFTGPGALGSEITVAEDSRVTRVGNWLRRWKIDELPQLLNVLDGSMSLVGPRPELPRFVALYTDDERAVLAFRPGITDPASLWYRNEEAILADVTDPQQYYVDVVMRDKVERNLAYARRATVSTDFRVLVETLVGVLKG